MAVYIIINIILLAKLYDGTESLGGAFWILLMLNVLFFGIIWLFKDDIPDSPPKKKAEKPEAVQRAEEEQNKRIAQNMRNYYINEWLYKENHRK